MSSSTSTAPPTPSGECVVCGKETSARCSKCAQGGESWMYFCSQEHQKLIWSIHKRICGGPFQWPALTPKEAAEMLQLSAFPIPGPNGFRTWLDSMENGAIESMVDKTGEPMTFDVKSFFATSLGHLQNDDKAHTPPGQDQLVRHRGSAFLTKRVINIIHDKPLCSDFQMLVASDPYGFLASSQLRQLDHGWNHSDASWYRGLQGRSLNLVGIIMAIKRTTDPVVVQRWTMYLAHTINVILDYARTIIQEDDRDQAKVVIEVYLPRMLEDCGVKLAIEGASSDKWSELGRGGKLLATDLVISGGDEVRVTAVDQN
ncbi:hypothetical protein JCM5353_007031 [Sporobolomyces roseus]